MKSTEFHPVHYDAHGRLRLPLLFWLVLLLQARTWVLFDLVQTDTIKNSLTLGSHILKKIKPVHKLHSRNTEQAAFVVLKSPSVPSVLVETSFITNPEEERLLGTAAFRQKIATAIAEGVISYFHWFDNQKAHSKKR